MRLFSVHSAPTPVRDRERRLQTRVRELQCEQSHSKVCVQLSSMHFMCCEQGLTSQADNATLKLSMEFHSSAVGVPQKGRKAASFQCTQRIGPRLYLSNFIRGGGSKFWLLKSTTLLMLKVLKVDPPPLRFLIAAWEGQKFSRGGSTPQLPVKYSPE